MKQLFTIITCLLTSSFAMAQNDMDEQLKQRLEGKTKFYDIKETVANFYKEKISALPVSDLSGRKQLNRELKFWNRSFYDNEGRLDANGEMVNVTKRVFEYLSSLSPQLIETANGAWQIAGPSSVSSGIGRINRIAFDPVNESLLYAGSASGGLYKTSNGGLSWQNISSFIPSLGISGIVVSHNSPSVIYILTGDGDAFASKGFNYSYGYIRYSVGVLKSTDGGTTWQLTDSLPVSMDKLVGFKLIQDPNNANVLFCTTNKGVFKTTNGGNSWAICDFQYIDDERLCFDIEFRPGSSNTIYCTAKDDNGWAVCYYSTNGFLFQESEMSPNFFVGATSTRIEIAVTPANANYVYLLCGPGFYETGNNLNDRFKGLLRSTNNGQTFTQRSETPDILGYDDILITFKSQSDYDLALAASPSFANTIISGGLVAWRSTNGGTDWDEIVDYFEDTDNSNYIHPDIHDLAYNVLNGKLYAATDGGVAVSSDNGDNWTRLYNGLTCTQFYHFGVQDDEGNIWGGAQDNGILRKLGTNAVFEEYAGGDGYDVLTDMAPAGNQDDKYYSVNQTVYADAIIDENITPDQVDETDAKNFFPNLAMSPTNEDVIYAGYPVLYVSYSRGDTWDDIGSPKVPGNWCVNTCPTNRKRIYAAGKRTGPTGAEGLYRVDNLDDVLPDVEIDLTNPLESAGYPGEHPKITDIEVSSNTSARLWVTVGGFTNSVKVFYSNNSGSSWTNISGSLPNLPVNCILADENDNVYIGTDIGVYYKGSGDADWSPFYNGLPRVPVSELEFLQIAGPSTLLYASTFGRGIWVSEPFSSCVSNLTISSNQVGQKFYQAGSTITTTSDVIGGAGTNVFFRAGTSVTLEPGFIVNTGTQFTGYIGPCNSGPVPFKSATGDSSVNVIKNIKAARQYGFVHDAVADGENITFTLKMFDAGSYAIRLYDIEMGAYVASLPVNLVNGKNMLNIQVKIDKGKHYRADLFKGDMLVHNTDISLK